MRLQKYLALCGVASRRHAEVLMAAGRVMVNGQTVTEMGAQAEEGDDVRVDGTRVFPETQKKYIMYHKPAGEVTTASDPEGRATVLDRFADYPVRLYPVGRLDYDSEGLLLLTNDGELAAVLTHPSHLIDKSYLARVTGDISDDSIRRLCAGVLLDGKKTAPARAHVVKRETFASIVMITIHEGRNRQVRRMLEVVGHKALSLQRVRFGPLALADLPKGQFRELTPAELAKLRSAAGLKV